MTKNANSSTSLDSPEAALALRILKNAGGDRFEAFQMCAGKLRDADPLTLRAYCAAMFWMVVRNGWSVVPEEKRLNLRATTLNFLAGVGIRKVV